MLRIKQYLTQGFNIKFLMRKIHNNGMIISQMLLIYG